MKKTKITLIILILLTVIAAFVSNSTGVYTTVVLLFLAALKFIGVSFYFMDLKDAHPFWKISTLFFLVIFIGTILIIL